LAEIRKRMGKEFEINVFPPVDVLSESSKTEDIRKWLNKILEDNNDGNLKIEYHPESEYHLQNCRFIHEELDKKGLVKKGRLH